MADAPKLVRAFLKEHGLTQSDAAKALAVSDPTMHDWLAEAKKPNATHRAAFAKWTGDAVPVDAWADAAERRKLASVEPFVPESKPAAPAARPDVPRTGS